MNNFMRKHISILLLGIVFVMFANSFSYAGTLDSWAEEGAYTPTPILFLHGFASCGPETWVNAKIDEQLNEQYFKKYKYREPFFSTTTLYSYLELINFVDSFHLGDSRQELIDRNSSIDTYKTGDYYVSQTGERNHGDPGWGDKVF